MDAYRTKECVLRCFPCSCLHSILGSRLSVWVSPAKTNTLARQLLLATLQTNAILVPPLLLRCARAMRVPLALRLAEALYSVSYNCISSGRYVEKDVSHIKRVSLAMQNKHNIRCTHRLSAAGLHDRARVLKQLERSR